MKHASCCRSHFKALPEIRASLKLGGDVLIKDTANQLPVPVPLIIENANDTAITNQYYEVLLQPRKIKLTRPFRQLV